MRGLSRCARDGEPSYFFAIFFRNLLALEQAAVVPLSAALAQRAAVPPHPH